MTDPDAGLRPLGEGGRSAHLFADGIRDVEIALLVDRENLREEGAPLLARSLCKGLEGASSGRDGPVHVLCRSHGNDARGRLGGRVDDREFLRLAGLDPAAADIEPAIVVRHGDPAASWMRCANSTTAS